MNSTTLQALRRLLFFTQAEAAALVGGVSERAWIHWESGTRPVPQDVDSRMQELAAWRENAVINAGDAIACAAKELPDGAEFEPPALVWYASVEDWMTLPGREPLLWRPQCSAIAHLCATHGCVAVKFDGPIYAQWLRASGHQDSEQTRCMWAADHMPRS